MSAHTALNAIFGKVTLPPGENQEAYALLQSQLEDLLKPKTILDHLRLRDLTDSIWEAARFKRLGTGLISGLYRDALEQLLAPLCGPSFAKARSIARDYYGNDPSVRATAALQVKNYGITEDQIQATAFGLATKQFDFFDRLLANRAATRKALLKEHERQQKRAAKAKPVEAEPVKHAATNVSPFPSRTFGGGTGASESGS
jgi:hypothetical protein